MKKKLINSRSFRKVLTLLGFTSTAFVFSACYGPLPQKYMDEVYTDSIQESFNAEDTLSAEIPVTEQTDSIQ